MRQGIEVMQQQSTANGRGLLLALIEYRNYLREMQRTSDADAVDRELIAVKAQMGSTCADCINMRSLAAK